MASSVISAGSSIQPVSTTPPLIGGGSGSGGVLALVSSLAPVTGLLGGLVSSETINKTIGQALKDGFKCWGATWTPTRAENEGPYWIGLISAEFKKSLDVPREELQASVNNFFKTFWGNIASDYDPNKTLEGWLGWRYDSARDCTKEGLIRLERIADGHLEQIVSTLPEIAKAINGTITVRRVAHTLYRYPQTKQKPFTKTIPQITVSLKNDVIEDVKDLGGNKMLQVMGGVGLALAGLFALFATTPDKKKRKSKSRKLYR